MQEIGTLVIVAALAIIHSVFGVGTLLFGTPLLLALDYRYQDALAWLLPPSAALSWTQAWRTRNEPLDGNYRIGFVVFCLPSLILGMGFSLDSNLINTIRTVVFLMLLFAIVIRLKPGGVSMLRNILQKKLPAALVAMGFVHGLSNMGGSLLTLLASGLYDGKQRVLAAVSLDYACMASIQLFILAISTKALRVENAIGAVVALISHWCVGRLIFFRTNEQVHQKLTTSLLAANAALLGWTLFRQQ